MENNIERAPHPVDVHVGRKLRIRRTAMGKSQEEIGEAVGITFQQIQKYERGLNRIGASRLYEFSQLLEIPVGYFFENLNENVPENTDDASIEEINGKEALTLVRAYLGIKNLLLRKKVLSMIKAMSEDLCKTS
jgi:transcriptional regulator with XRE-family HTH domain